MPKTIQVIKRETYNPASVVHRACLQSFMETGKWDKHFVIEEGVNNLPYHLMKQTLNYYWHNAKQFKEASNNS